MPHDGEVGGVNAPSTFAERSKVRLFESVEAPRPTNGQRVAKDARRARHAVPLQKNEGQR